MSDTTVPAVDEAKAVALAREIDPILEVAERFVVISLPSYEEAMRMAAICAAYSPKWEALYREDADLAHALHKSLVAKIKARCGPLEQAVATLGRKAREWKRSEDEKARKAEEARQAEARRLIEEERILQATALAARGKTALADAVLAAPVEVVRERPAEVVQPVGTAEREKWTWELVDIEAVPRKYFVLDALMIGAEVRELKAGCRIPGIRAYNEGTTAFSRK